MEAAKASVKKFISKDGKHDTSVHETVAPAVQNETVVAQQHERETTAVDKEVHQDHYHTSEQPVYDQQTLPEQHHHRVGQVEERSFEHDNPSQVQERLAAEQAKYRDTSTRVEGDRTREAAPVVGGEHVHHHVHENIQPVVQKQTIEPHVVHTTKPIHEVHHNAAQHHTSSALPAVSMEEFKRQGGSLTGREERRDQFEGCPPEQFAAHGNSGASSGLATGAAGGAAGAGLGRDRRGSTSSLSSSDEESRSTGIRKKDRLGTRKPGKPAKSGPNYTGAGAGAGTGAAVGSSGHQHPQPGSYGNDMHTGQTQGHKPSMMDKLNPKKDADGDGKPGFMK